ncbi:MAG TPA: 2-dehydropantoate 2-reductase [Candidatus Hydrothermia bacterium]|nr:2-dehydropantoate 2-reductase [Candidatus Hydrothermae bacterium]MDD3649028.1 2-dehydropantoate 2-reductase [Candidatus Hydrothermia bacterium]MDD5573262.1 2-dehydropantoate 2-reductase [Candidatus Hydrothermia bacterium]HOK22967.1 2-dehydropantoate 2-reductase [Candidatus Hydrothermia bacterium]HOL23773.1 2-dehydropantoate 2-reductase [Candidatus Hydrothermia bacterium]
MKIVILGAGSVGGLLVSKFVLAGNVVEVIVNKRSSKRHIETEGIEYFYLEKRYVIKVPCYVYEDLKDIEADYLIIATKSYDAIRIIKEIGDKHFSFNYLVTVQNGIEPHLAATEIFREDHLILSLREGVYSFDVHKIRHTRSDFTQNIVTSFEASRESMEQFAEILNTADIRSVVSYDGWQILYEKLALNSVINPLATILRVKNGFLIKLLNSPTVTNLITEAVKVISLEGVHLNIQEVKENLRSLIQATYDNRCSMLQDIEQKKKTEIEFINGYLLKLAQKYNMGLPSHQLVYDLVTSLEELYGTH